MCFLAVVTNATHEDTEDVLKEYTAKPKEYLGEEVGGGFKFEVDPPCRGKTPTSHEWLESPNKTAGDVIQKVVGKLNGLHVQLKSETCRGKKLVSVELDEDTGHVFVTAESSYSIVGRGLKLLKDHR